MKTGIWPHILVKVIAYSFLVAASTSCLAFYGGSSPQEERSIASGSPFLELIFVLWNGCVVFPVAAAVLLGIFAAVHLAGRFALLVYLLILAALGLAIATFRSISGTHDVVHWVAITLAFVVVTQAVRHWKATNAVPT